MSLYGRGYIDALRFVERTMWKPDFDDLDDLGAPDDREQYKRGWEDGLKHGARVASYSLSKLADALEDALKMNEGEA